MTLEQLAKKLKGKKFTEKEIIEAINATVRQTMVPKRIELPKEFFRELTLRLMKDYVPENDKKI